MMPVSEKTAARGTVASARLVALDGLRGIAAMAVFIGHCLAVDPIFDAAVAGRAEPTGFAWWMTYTPLHLVWLGHEAVVVFFVLSGFVLTLPVLAGRIQWRSFYPKRLLRLYVPAWMSLVFGVAVTALIPRLSSPEQSDWMNTKASEPTVAELLADVLTLSGDTRINGVLWSLRWEVVFSLLLPLYIFAAVRLRRWLVAKLVAVLGIVVAGTVASSGALVFLPMFAIGVLMAVENDSLERMAGRLNRIEWAGLVVAALLLLCVNWLPIGLPKSDLLPLVGAALLLFAFIGHSGCRRLGEVAPCRWLGQRSFSLYLVHTPIVVSVAQLSDTTNPLLVIAMSLPLTLLTTEIFFRAVERPSHRLATAVGRLAAGRRAPQRPDESATPSPKVPAAPPDVVAATPQPDARDRSTIDNSAL